MPREDDDSLLSRWSRRKRAVAEEERADLAPAESAEPETNEEPVSEGDETEQATLARLGLPSPESLGPGDDFSGFMRSGVPEYLRRRALRRLWRSNPVLANLDGLNDYDEDFTSAAETGKILKSAYQIGRGFLREETPPKEAEVSADGEELASAEEKTKDSSQDALGADPADSKSPATISTPADADTTDAAEDSEKPQKIGPKRMRFTS